MPDIARGAKIGWRMAVCFWPLTVVLLVLAVTDSCSMVIENSAQTRCLARGYPAHTVTMTFRTFCSRRLNNTDEVIELP